VQLGAGVARARQTAAGGRPGLHPEVAAVLLTRRSAATLLAPNRLCND